MKAKTMKPVKAWVIVQDGKFEWPSVTQLYDTKADALCDQITGNHERIVRVELRELKPSKRRKK